MTALQAIGVGYRVGGRQVLAGVDLTVESGELVAVTGPSGSGKSTLLGLLAGLEQPQTGSVLLDGLPVTQAPPAVRRRFGLQFQHHGLMATLTAAENVALPLQARRWSRRQIHERVTAELRRLGLATEQDRLAEELSGGQRQRVALARALAGDPDVLLVDEPTSELDPDSRETVLGLLAEHAERGALVVAASHDAEVAAAAQRVVQLLDGRLATPAA